jgi:hypothetical protein
MGKSSRRTQTSSTTNATPSPEAIRAFLGAKRTHYIEVSNRSAEGTPYKKFNARAAKIYTYAYNNDQENYRAYKLKWVESANEILKTFKDNEQMLEALHTKMTKEMQEIIGIEQLVFSDL